MAQIFAQAQKPEPMKIDACCGTSNVMAWLTRLFRTARTCQGCVGGCDECRVPRPFWWPQLAARISSHVCPGAVATIRVIVENDGPSPRTFEVLVLPPELAANAVVSEDKFKLLPFQQRAITVSYFVKGDTPIGQVDEPMIWIRGCLDHVIVWRVTASKLSTTVCNEVTLRDAPDYEHHWYDHFYCDHPCRNKA